MCGMRRSARSRSSIRPRFAFLDRHGADRAGLPALCFFHEPPCRAQAEALVFLGKVGFSVSQEHLNEGSFGQYDGEFLVLDEADRLMGDVIDSARHFALRVQCASADTTPPSRPTQYRRLMQFNREGCTAAGFSREITVIDYGFTPDTESSSLKSQSLRVQKVPAFIYGTFFYTFYFNAPPAIILRRW